ncbi:chain-length determining protein [Salinicola endophyticus]|uniref:Chain-length determining protein n=1 Tax=Salinicola endophyticus TaxID=1949083 RepID=A0ABY8FLY2_9GAMM|nr:chain-length determining protein [Salinicola endophyticus]WFF42653.1 chain-length determining protein [Salinicola endophyticus]
MRFKIFFLKYPHWAVCALVVVLNSFYWFAVASDRYVSHANVVLESPQLSQPQLNFGALLSGASGNADMLILRDYMRSTDMLKLLNKELGFSSKYSDDRIDFFSRLSSANAPLEVMHDYFLKRVSVEVDDYAGVLRVDVEGFDPKTAHAVNETLLSEGEKHMNALGRQLAQEQVKFLEKQVDQLRAGYKEAQQSLLDYQNDNGLVSPTGTVESLSSVVASLQAKRAKLEAEKNALMSYQSANAPQVVRVNSEIQAIAKQISNEQSRLAANSGTALNAISSEYQSLQLEAKFAQESYSGALAALESTRIEAARKLKQLSILQSPTLPEYPEMPKRLYNSVLFGLIALFVAFIINMLIVIVKDHRD